MTKPRMTARASFGPVVLLGLATSGFAAIAGHQTMLEVPQDYLKDNGLTALSGQDLATAEFPLAGALGLVALACWGVLLVTRGVVRRVVAVLAVLATAGVLGVLVLGGFVQRDDAARDVADQLGMTSVATPPMDRTAWFWVGLACAVLAVVVAAAAVRLVPAWPEMGTRYDAPTGAAPAADAPTTASTDPSERSNLDLWKALDDGADPTQGPADHTD